MGMKNRKPTSTHHFALTFNDVMMELASPILNNPKILKKVDFMYLQNIEHELASRKDGIYFRSNDQMKKKIVEEKADLKTHETFLFR